MKYDVFMKTRTYDRDYEWVNKPNYMPNGMYETCKSLIGLCESDDFSSLGTEDWHSNFFYLRLDGCCMLARVAKTSYTTSTGQHILSFEGVCVRDEQENQLFYNIPGIINELLPPAKCFRTRFEEEGSMSDTIDVDWLPDPFSGNVPDEVHPTVENNVAYKNLLKYTAFTDKPVGYMFGKNVRDFAGHVDKGGLGLIYVFDFNDPDTPNVDENTFKDNYDALVCEYKELVPTGKDKVAINLFVQETGEDSYRYSWIIKPWDDGVKDSKRVRYATRFYDVGNSIELAKLELQKESIKKFLIDNGWTKQPVGLRFEKDTYQQADAASK
jgi:hypothetical protein